MNIVDEKYEKRFIWLRRRTFDGRWFFLKFAHQYYVKFSPSLRDYVFEPESDWVAISGDIYDSEELTLRLLQGQKMYINDR